MFSQGGVISENSTPLTLLRSCTVLHCAVLCCIVLCVLCCTVLYVLVAYCVTLPVLSSPVLSPAILVPTLPPSMQGCLVFVSVSVSESVFTSALSITIRAIDSLLRSKGKGVYWRESTYGHVLYGTDCHSYQYSTITNIS